MGPPQLEFVLAESNNAGLRRAADYATQSLQRAMPKLTILDTKELDCYDIVAAMCDIMSTPIYWRSVASTYNNVVSKRLQDMGVSMGSNALTVFLTGWPVWSSAIGRRFSHPVHGVSDESFNMGFATRFVLCLSHCGSLCSCPGPDYGLANIALHETGHLLLDFEDKGFFGGGHHCARKNCAMTIRLSDGDLMSDSMRYWLENSPPYCAEHQAVINRKFLDGVNH